ncbi:MAG: methyl-accepting chemotaxis protein [Pseudomonadota bacterium]
MQFLSNLRIGPRLILAFALLLMLNLAVGLYGINRLGAVNANTEEIATNWLPASEALGDTRSAINRSRRMEANYLMASTPERRQSARAGINDGLKAADTFWAVYRRTVVAAEEEGLAKAVEAARADYLKAQAKLLSMPLDDAAQEEAARAFFEGESRLAMEAVFAAMEKAQDYQTAGGQKAYEAAQASFQSTRLMVAALLGLAVALGGVLAWLITRSITAPIAQAVRVAETVAAGDLRSRIVAEGKDETARLLRALQTMNDQLVDIVGQVRNGADSIATGSTQIATGNADLSQRTEEQASNLQQTAASMEQLTSTVKQNADTASQATQLAGGASSAAARGGEVVGQVVATMQAISDSSTRIEDIIGVIDGIAFQTNILALNAAVEAARAGEQGRGFAVVAGEVRSLAQRSAGAAHEIKRLISDSKGKVQDGSRLVAEAGQSMQDIVLQVGRVSDLIGEISAASAEQSTGIEQIGMAVSQLDQVTQQNAALVEESAAAAESLRRQAADLTGKMAVFKLAA